MGLFQKMFNKDRSKQSQWKLHKNTRTKSRLLRIEQLEDRQLLSVVTGNPVPMATTWVSNESIAVAQAPMPTTDATVLDTPTDFTATSVKKDSISLTWKEVDYAGSYEVQYKLESETEWVTAGETSKTSEGTISYSLDILNSDTTYNIRVRALPVSGSVDYTASGYTAMTQKTMTPLPTPANFNAVYHDNNNSITVTWDPIDSSYTGQYEISVYQGNKELFGTKTNTDNLSDNSYTFTCFSYDDQGDPLIYFESNTLYTFTIMAKSEQTDYDDSHIAETSLTTPKSPLGTPKILADSTYAESSTAIYVTWEGDSAAYNYLVKYRVAETETWTNISTQNNNTNIRIAGLSSDTTYEVQVTAKANPDGTGEFADSDPSDIYSVKTLNKLAPPTNLAVTEVADHSISISWESVENADAYIVSCFRDDFPGKLMTTDVSSTAYTISSLDSNTNYSIWVRATNADTTYEQSESSNILKLKTLKTTLTAPENFRSTARDLDSVTLDWNKVEDVDHYLIEYKWESDTSWQQITTNMTRQKIDALDSGRVYEFRVYSIANPEGDFIDSAPSNSIEVKTLAKINTPWNLEVYNKSNNYISLQWAQITDPLGTSYEVAWYPTDDPSQISTKSVDDCVIGIEGLDSNQSYTFKVKAVSSDSDYVDSDFCSPIDQKTDYEIRLDPDFTTTIAYNQTSVLGTIFIDDFNNPKDTTPTFTVNGTPNTDNFSAIWDEEQNGFVVTFNNDNKKFDPIKYELRITTTEGDKTASTVFPITLTAITDINGLIVYGIEDTDWVWNETAKNLLVKGNITVTGTASSDMTISVEKNASVTNNKVNYTGVSDNETPGTLAIMEGEGITDEPSMTAGVLFDNTYYYCASNASFTIDGATFTNTSETIEKLKLGSDGVNFLSGEWNVDVKEGEVLTVAAVSANVLVHFSENDKFAFSVVTYTVGDNGGGFNWNDHDYRTCLYGIDFATTGNFYSGVTFSSTSSNAYGMDASYSLQYLSYNFLVYDGDWTATLNGNTKGDINPTMILQNGSLTAQLKNGSEKTFHYSDATVNGVNASAVTIDFDRTDASIKNITTGYEISGFLYVGNSTEQIITCSSIDTVAKTISLNQGSWSVQIMTLDTVGSMVLTTISDSASLRGTENDAVYSSPFGAINSTFEVVEIDVEVEGQPKNYHTRIQNGVDDYLLGSVVVSADYGKHTAPVINKDLMTMTITGGDWYVSDFLTGMVGGTVVLKGGSFTDANGDSVIFHGQVIPLTVKGNGVLDLTTLTTVTTAADVVDLYDDVISLREAISYADANASWGNVITFSNDIDWANPDSTITLDVIYGGLVIDHTLTIDGKTQNVSINGNHIGSVFNIEDNAGTAETPVEIKGLTITGGTGTVDTSETYGGAIYNNGVVVVMDSTFTDNIAKYGGAVANFKQFTMIDSTMTTNRAIANGGGFYNKGDATQLTIANSTIVRNIADYGGGTFNVGGKLTLVNSIVVGSMDARGTAITDVYISYYPGLNYAYYSTLGSVVNQATEKSGLDAFDGGASGVLGSVTGKSYEDIFGENGFDGQTVRIENNSFAATSGTLVGFIGQTIYYYNKDDGYWWNAATNTKSEYQFDAEDLNTYGLTGGLVDVVSQNRDDEGNRVSRVLTTRFFAAGAFAINETPEAPSVVVTTANDIVNPYDDVISLREAISYADANASWGNVITFSDAIDWADPANTITLEVANGSLVIARTLTIDGKAQNVAINGNFIWNVSNGVGSVFTIESTAGTAEIPVSIKGLTITGGNGTQIGDDTLGGAILNYGIVTVEYSVLQNNGAYYGAGVANFNQFTILNSTLYNNNATNDGGAFYNKGTNAQLTIGNSTVAENNGNHGGAIYNDGGTLLFVNSIVVGNSGNFDIVFDNGGLNYAYYSIFGSVYNEKTNKPNGDAFDGGATGIYGSCFSKEYKNVFGTNDFDGQTIKIDRTSIAANSGTLVGFIGQTCYYYNVNDGFWWNGTTNTKSEYQFDAEDTTSYGLTGGSIFIDGQNMDTAGNHVSRVVTTKAFSIGAYTIERIPDTPSTIVTITDDLVDPFDDEISLREAILYAGTSYVDASGITHTLGTDITFDPVVFANGGTITLTAQLGPYLKQENAALFIDKSLSIDTTVNGELKEIIIDGKNIDDSVFYITDSAGTDLSQSKVLLKGLTITGGTGRFDNIFNLKDHFGGAIYNTGALELLNCTIKENKAYQGGGILNLGYLSVKDSVLTANEAERFGGAIHNSGYMILNGVTMTDNSAHCGGSITNAGIATLPAFLDVKQVTAVMSDVSFENNSANNGGAICNWGYRGNLSITIDNCSFKENSAEVYGGAVHLFAYNNSTIDCAINNSSFIKNSAGESGGAINIEVVVSYEIEIPTKIGTIELVLCNSLVADNTAKEYGGGLAIYNGTVTLRNVTIAGNSVVNAGGNGGGIYSSLETELDHVALYNTIIAANLASDGITPSDIALASGKYNKIIGYNTLSTYRDWTEGENNNSCSTYLSLFKDVKNSDYTLANDSQAIDQGNNTYAVDANNIAIENDLNGNPRIVRNVVDLGAYECQNPDSPITLSSDFKTSASFNQITVLGDIFMTDFTNPKMATPTFFVDGVANTENFSARWDNESNGFAVTFNNSIQSLSVGEHVIKIEAHEGDKTDSTIFTFTVTPVTEINGLVLSGIEGTDWIWNESTMNLEVKGQIVVTGSASSDMTITLEEDASVSNNVVDIMSTSEEPGTLALGTGEELTDELNVTSGVVFDGLTYSFAKNETFIIKGVTFTNTSEMVGKLQYESNGVCFISGTWNVDVKDDEILTVADVYPGASVEFNANAQYAFSVATYTVGDNGGGFIWNDDEFQTNMYGIDFATTGNSYSGVTLTSTSSNAYGTDSSPVGYDLSYNFMIDAGDWTVTTNDDTQMATDLLAILHNGSISCQLKNGEEKTFKFSDAKVDETNARSVIIDLDYTDAKIENVTTNYEISSFIYMCESTDQIVTCSAIDRVNNTISFNQGDWDIQLFMLNAEGVTISTTISETATLQGTETSEIFSTPKDAIRSTFEVVLLKTEIEGQPTQYDTRIQNGVDDYLLGSVIVSADYGDYTAPTLSENTITITDGDWRVTDHTTDNIDGTIILAGGSFTDATGSSVTYKGNTLTLSIDGKGHFKPFLFLSSDNQEIQEPQSGQVVLSDVTVVGMIGDISYTFTDSNNNNLNAYFAITENEQHESVFCYLGGLTNDFYSITITATDTEQNKVSAEFNLATYDLYYTSSESYTDYRLDIDDSDLGTLYGTDSFGDETIIQTFTVHPGESIVKIKGGMVGQPKLFTLSSTALMSLKTIYINDEDKQDNVKDTLILQATNNGLAFTLDKNNQGGNGNTEQKGLFGAGSITTATIDNMAPIQKATIIYSGIKNTYIETNGHDNFKINSLTTNINLRGTATASSIEQIDFSNMNVNSDELGIILNLANLGLSYHQAAVIGQQGTLAFNKEVASVILSGGTDTIYGSTSGSTISDATNSESVISLKGGDNNVSLNGTATIVAVKETNANTIVIDNADGSVVNLAKSTGRNEMTITGDDIILTGGIGENDLVITGENAFVNLTMGANSTVTLHGDIAIVTTGKGNDTINLIGCDNSVTTGEGDDIINVADDDQIFRISSHNSINAGNGNDFIYALLSSGSNTYCAGNGNDFIIGGRGNDTIYGNAGNNFLAGYLGTDKIYGGNGRDILVADRTSLMSDLSRKAMETLFTELQKDWMGSEWDQEKTLDLLGQNATSDGQSDTLKRVGGELNLFFESLSDSDIDNALAVDFRYFE